MVLMNFQRTLGFTKRLLWCLIFIGILFSLASAPVAYAQTNIYKSLQYPFYDPNPSALECGAGGGGPGISPNESPTDSVKAFVDAYGQMAYNDALKSGVPWEVTLAQAIVESGYGQSELSAKYNNFFGIKAGGNWNGPTVQMITKECNDNGCYDTVGTFRVYGSAQESFTDHSDFLRTNERYFGAFQFSNDPIKFIKAVADAGYATSPDYFSTVGRVVQQIINYNAQAKLFTPSSQIQFNVPPPGTATGAVSGNACPNSASGDTIDLGSNIRMTKLSEPIETPGGQITPKGVTLHWWGGRSNGQGISELVSGLRNNTTCGSSGCSVQIGILEDGSVYQMTNSLTDFAYHAIGANETTIGIEIEGVPADFGRAGITKYPQKFAAVVATVKYLVKTFNMPLIGQVICGNVSGVHSHKDYNGCPGAYAKQDIDDYYFNAVIKAVKQ